MLISGSYHELLNIPRARGALPTERIRIVEGRVGGPRMAVLSCMARGSETWRAGRVGGFNGQGCLMRQQASTRPWHRHLTLDGKRKRLGIRLGPGP